jgi:hypothetical protein
MINKEKEETGYLSAIVLLVLFFLLVLSFSNKTSNQYSASHHSVINIEFKSDFNLNKSNAAIASAAQFSFIEIGLIVSRIVKLNMFDKNTKLDADNTNLKRQFIVLREFESIIKPILVVKLLHRRVQSNTEDLPILS